VPPARIPSSTRVINVQEERSLSIKEQLDADLAKDEIVALNNSVCHVAICSIGLLICSMIFATKPQLPLLLKTAICIPFMLLLRLPFDFNAYYKMNKSSVALNSWFDLMNKLIHAAVLYLLSEVIDGKDYKNYLYYCIVFQAVNYVLFLVGFKRCKENKLVF
jgi:hypothetical protein